MLLQVRSLYTLEGSLESILQAAVQTRKGLSHCGQRLFLAEISDFDAQQSNAQTSMVRHVVSDDDGTRSNLCRPH
jgi:hypothetical protein